MSRLDDSYALQVRSVRSRLEDFTRTQFTAGQYRDADVERFVRQVLPLVLAGRKQVSLLTDAYLAATLTEQLGRLVRPRGGIDTDALRGVDPAEVYERPFKTLWTKLSEGKSLEVGISAGLARLTDLVLTDMQLAKRNTAQSVYSDTDGISGFVRTLTGSKSCALCYVASTQRYSKSDLLPIHPGCDCGTRAILPGDRATGDARLEGTHEALEDRFGVSNRAARRPDYRKAIVVEEHGEMGPVLTVKSHRFTAADDLPRI